MEENKLTVSQQRYLRETGQYPKNIETGKLTEEYIDWLEKTFLNVALK